jgi:two-component system response regulator YesN
MMKNSLFVLLQLLPAHLHPVKETTYLINLFPQFIKYRRLNVMKMSWYYKMLLSYTPIFFVVISVLIFSFFAVLNDSAQKQVVKTNEVISTKVSQVVDANLKSAERMVIKESYLNSGLKEFFGESNDKQLYDYFRISQSMDEISSSLPFSNSIYLYNAKAGNILSRSALSPLEQFGDKEFLLASFHSPKGAKVWSDPRLFKEFNHEKGNERFVTMVKFYPDTGDRQGAIVVNIRVQALTSFVKDLTRLDAVSFALLQSNREPFDGNAGVAAAGTKAGAEATFIKSEYTGWQYGSYGSYGKRLSLLSLLNDFWLLVGILTITSGLVWFTYITHRSYKPIQAIAERIQDYTKRKSGELVKTNVNDDLKYIELAIDGLLERAGQYEQQHMDDLLIRKRQMLLDWLEGHKVMSHTQWQLAMEALQMPLEFYRITVAVLEIDRFAQFVRTYNSRDQYLLKFVLSNVLQETAQDDQITVWNEWLEPQQMAIIFYLDEDTAAEKAKVDKVMKTLQDWVLNNLDFTISAAIGSEAQYPEDVVQSYAEAKEYVSFKPVFGVGSIIRGEDIHSKEAGRIFPHLQLVWTAAKSIRLADGGWQFHCEQLFQALKKGRISQTDLETITNYMMYHVHKELTDMSEEVNRQMESRYLPEFEALAGDSETLEEWQERLCSLLAQMEETIRVSRLSKNNYALVRQVKEYIEAHYADPGLSLNQISERFAMNPRYLSKLFKEEFGEKFIDYMLKIRLEESQRLLLDTVLPIQDIAEQVGYNHVLSFHRAFKNIYGLTPGDYRKRPEGV